LKAFRPLLLFWAAVLGVLAGGVGALQVLGPEPSSRVPIVARPLVVAAAPPPSAPAVMTPPVLAPASIVPTVPVPVPAARVPAGPVAEPARVRPGTANPAPPTPMVAGAIPDPDPRLQEPAETLPDRVLPRVDDAGHAPESLYAAAFDPSERHPRVALVIDGAGLDRALTAQANSTLPAAIDFAYSAYAPSPAANALAAAGRRLGRECLVSIPMEPNGFPANEEGNRALLTGADPEEMRTNLDWALSNVQGCVGGTGASDGMGGERFASSEQAFGDVLTALSRRGLIYLDSRPGAGPPTDDAPGRRLPYVADLVVDHAPSPGEPLDAHTIDLNLARLEEVATHRGSAIGIAGPLTPVLLDRVAVWAQGLAARGLVLAPLTAIPVPSPTSTLSVPPPNSLASPTTSPTPPSSPP
jgi:polysaccharide deacetylase 2 family uncharacterized protein YibQ